MPLQWLGIWLRLCLQILQVHIARVHLGLVQFQIMLPHLQGMHYGKGLFLLSWLSPWAIIELHAPIRNGHPSCINIHQWQSPSPPHAPQNAFENPEPWPHIAKRICSWTPLRLCDKAPTIFKIAIIFTNRTRLDNHQDLCSRMHWPFILRWQSTNGKVKRPRMHLKMFVKFYKFEHRWQR